MQNRVRILLLLLVAYLGLVVFANRALLFSRFDASFWKDKYDQSQWKLPLSQRTIGDDGLYLYEGYQLIHGGDPSLSNAEVPPLGKYLIGSSIKVFGNGYAYGFLVTTITLAATYLTGLTIVGSAVPALAVTLLLATDPLMTNQYTLTMMDALQAMFLMLSLAVVFRTRKENILFALVAGLFVGLFSGTKIAVLTPVIALAEGVYLYLATKRIQAPVLFVLGIAGGYFLPYVPYFFLGHSPLDWLKLQKWIVAFYRHSNLTPTWGSALMTLMAGKYQDIFSRSWHTAGEWSPVWAVLVISTGAGFIRWLRTHRPDAKVGTLYALFVLPLITLSLVPFWTRYLVAILPVLYLAAGVALVKLPRRLTYLMLGVFILINSAASWHILFPSPQASVTQFTYQLEHRLFADIYEDVTTGTKSSISRQRFVSFGLGTLLDGEIEYLHVDQTSLKKNSASSYTLYATVNYGTERLGTFTRPIAVPFIREDNRWRIPWTWSLLLPGLNDHDRVQTTIVPAKRGAIIGSDKKPLAEDVPGYRVSVIPGKVERSQEDALLSTLETLFNGSLPKVALHQRIFGNTLPTRAVPIGVIPHQKTDPNIDRLKTFSGVVLSDAYTRLTYPNHVVDIGELKNTAFSECCSRLYATTNYDGISGTEKKWNEILKGYTGGSLTRLDERGTVVDTYIAREAKNGESRQP